MRRRNLPVHHPELPERVLPERAVSARHVECCLRSRRDLRAVCLW
jgi:hypothetical protein